MAESRLWSFLKESAKEIFKDIPADAIALYVYHKLTGKAKDKLDDPGLGIDQRASVEVSMVTIELARQRKLTNIREWRRQASVNQFPFAENDFTMLMAEIPTVDRSTVYQEWDGLTRAEFIQRLDGLNHDYIAQKAKRAWSFSRPYVKKGRDDFGNWLQAQANHASARRQAREHDRQLHEPRQPSLRRVVRWRVWLGLVVIPLGLCLLCIIISQLTSR